MKHSSDWSIPELSFESGVKVAYLNRLCVTGKLSASRRSERGKWRIGNKVARQFCKERGAFRTPKERDDFYKTWSTRRSPYYTVSELAVRYNVDRNLIAVGCRCGAIPSVQLNSSSYRIRFSDIDKVEKYTKQCAKGDA